MNEIWKDILGYEGLYQISNLGDVRSLNYNHTGEIKLLKQSTDKYGYKRVGLFKNGKEKKYLIHRLVAMTFIPNPDNLPIINHKDEDKTNNNVNNLEWCTYEYNNNYGTRNERVSESMRGENNPLYGKCHREETKKKMSEKMKGKNLKPILMYDKEGNFIRRFNSIGEANEYFGKNRNCSSISNCLNGRKKTTYNYIFKYEDEENKK